MNLFHDFIPLQPLQTGLSVSYVIYGTEFPEFYYPIEQVLPAHKIKQSKGGQNVKPKFK